MADIYKKGDIETMDQDEKIKALKNYEVLEEKFIPDVNSKGWLLRHKKTGARIALLSNSDENKVFHIGFRTPVDNDKGTPHIIEHTVLCGSDKFPVKDPFMELAKGSLNTFLNAMTYPDKTVYPVASCNTRDFKNLMDVYMDAVFHPHIYSEEKIFCQEGWHYEMENENSDLSYNGIVYNEMKGVFSSVDGIIERSTLQSLFPDTGYAYESGGDPDCIPKLSYEEYLDFHRKYYHPSNSYIYLYGDMDMAERLEWLDKEYLGSYDMLDADFSIDRQEKFDSPVYKEISYPISDSNPLDENAVLTLNYVTGKDPDPELDIAFQVLEYALTEVQGAPLKQALIDAGIGENISSQYEGDIRQPIYSIVAKHTDKNKNDEFLSIIDKTLNNLVENGIDKKSLHAALNVIEFSTREADFGNYPKGLIYGLQMMDSWLYDDDRPFDMLETNEIFDKLRTEIDKGYFEDLVREFLINNNHRSNVVLVPEHGLDVKREKALKEKLAIKKAGMSKDEIDNIVKKTAELKAYQKEPSTKKELESIPLLKISDIDKDPMPIIGKSVVDGNIKALNTDIFTNGIAYIDIVFDCSDIGEEYYPYLGLMKNILGYMDTDEHTYMDLNTDIDFALGGFRFDTAVYRSVKSGNVTVTGEIHAKSLYKNQQKVFDIASEIIKHTHFDDYKRLKEILNELKSRMHSFIVNAGDSAARQRALSFQSEIYHIDEQLSGISLYQFVSDLCENFDERKEEFVSKFEETVKYVFHGDKMLLNYTGDRKHFEKAKESSKEFLSSMYQTERHKGQKKEFKPASVSEGFKTSGQVQYVARAGLYNNPKECEMFDGCFLVLANIMRCEYLWDNIRVLGGAYGCNAMFSRDGEVAFTSYRDPNLKKTSDVFINAADYTENFDADSRQMTKFIIGTISTMDRPLSASNRGIREWTLFMTDIDDNILKNERDRVLSATKEDIRNLSPLIKKAMNGGNICVIGSKSAIEENEELFDRTEEIL